MYSSGNMDVRNWVHLFESNITYPTNRWSNKHPGCTLRTFLHTYCIFFGCVYMYWYKMNVLLKFNEPLTSNIATRFQETIKERQEKRAV